jgi:transposase
VARKDGRPHRKLALTPETRERILRLIKLGNYVETACSMAAIHRDTLNGWMQRAKKGEEPFATFAKDFDEASAFAEARLLGIIDQVAMNKEDPRTAFFAAAWKLERRFADRWGRRVAVTGKDGGAIQQVVVHVSQEMARAFDEPAVEPPSLPSLPELPPPEETTH